MIVNPESISSIYQKDEEASQIKAKKTVIIVLAATIAIILPIVIIRGYNNMRISPFSVL